MKVIAQSAALQEGLALASSIVAARTPKPVLQCVKLIAKGMKVKIGGNWRSVGESQVRPLSVEYCTNPFSPIAIARL